MIIKIPLLKRHGLKRIGGGLWRATRDDSYILLRSRLLRAAYFIIVLEQADCVLASSFYVDSGDGLEPVGAPLLLSGTIGVYLIDVRSFGETRAVRFDPHQGCAQFHMSAYAAYSLTHARAFVARRLRQARAAGKSIIHRFLSGENASINTGRKVRGVGDFFDQVVTLAAAKSQLVAPAAPVARLSFICPVYNTPPRYLDDLYASFESQNPGVWELILIDDASADPHTRAWLARHQEARGVKVARVEVNGGIACAINLGLTIAQGAWVGFIDHDDALAPYALERVLATLAAYPQARLIYTDEMVSDKHLNPVAYFAKPAFDPVLLSGVNYVNHLCLYRRDLLEELEGLRAGMDGSQDYDLLLRASARLDPRDIVHLPYPAYLWRRDGRSYSVAHAQKAIVRARDALGLAYADSQGSARVDEALNADLHRVRLDLRISRWPSMSIVIPSKNAYALIAPLLAHLTEEADYPDLEIIVIDNGSNDPRVLALYERMRARWPNFQAEVMPAPFNFSAQANLGFTRARGEAVLLLNNDVQAQEPGWIKEMASCLAYPNAGIVGARLLYPSGQLQHAGVIVGLDDLAGQWFCGKEALFPGPMGRLAVRQSYSAVTGACMLISRPCLEAVGGFDENRFAIAYNDIDFCLRAAQKGFRTVWTPFATLIHHESVSRGSDAQGRNLARFRKEQDALRQAHQTARFEDPAYSPFWARSKGAARLQVPLDLPVPRVWTFSQPPRRDGASCAVGMEPI